MPSACLYVLYVCIVTSMQRCRVVPWLPINRTCRCAVADACFAGRDRCHLLTALGQPAELYGIMWRPVCNATSTWPTASYCDLLCLLCE